MLQTPVSAMHLPGFFSAGFKPTFGSEIPGRRMLYESCKTASSTSR